jgi:serine/threonine-protein kinase RsbW
MAGEDIGLSGRADIGGLEAIYGLLEDLGNSHPQVSSTELMLFTTAVMEIANNIVEHGQPQGSVHWDVRLAVQDGALEATLVDTAEEFVPDLFAEMPEADALAEGGRGIPLVRTLVDTLDFSRTDDRNRWRLVRRYDDRD